MKILNPLYDSAFKYLMTDNNIAKIVLSIILDTKIISLQAQPQETTLDSNGLLRFDYKAIIIDESGETKTVLVEVQKYNSPNPIKRFRDYLASNYARKEIIQTDNGEKEQTLPLVSIYIIGFDLPEFDCRAVRVDNIPYDIVRKERLYVKSKFVEQLTHKSYILIAKDKKIKVGDDEKQYTLFELLLDLFIQKLKGEKSNPVININKDSYNNELKPIIERLERATLDGELLRKVQMEQDYIDNEISKDRQLSEAKQREIEAKQSEKAAKQREKEAKQREKEANQREIEAKQKLAKKC